jgi:hypothetical protein
MPHTALWLPAAWRKVATSWVRHTQEVQFGNLAGGQGEVCGGEVVKQVRGYGGDERDGLGGAQLAEGDVGQADM